MNEPEAQQAVGGYLAPLGTSTAALEMMGDDTEMKKEPLESIASSLRFFVWIIAVPSLAFGIFLFCLMFSFISQRLEQKKLESSRVIVASDDLPADTLLTTNNVGVKSCLNTDLKDDGISLDQVDVLLGHRLRTSRKKLEPIRWHDTDIVITNQNSLQQSSPGDGKPAPEK